MKKKKYPSSPPRKESIPDLASELNWVFSRRQKAELDGRGTTTNHGMRTKTILTTLAKHCNARASNTSAG